MTSAAASDKMFEACLVELHKTMRAASFYTFDHPALAQAADRALRSFQTLLNAVDSLEFVITRQGILVDERPLRGQPQILSVLAGELFRRRVKKLIFLPGIELDDILGFLRAVKLDAGELMRRGGFENALAQFGVKAIWPNEVDFSRLEDALDYGEDADGDEFSHHQGALDQTEELAPLTPQQEELRTLLKRLLASDGGPFMLLLKDLVALGRRLLEENAHAEVGLILDTLLDCTADQRRHLTAREYSEKAIRALATRDVVLYLIAQLEKAGERQIERLSALFEMIGRLSIPFLLTALATANNRNARRNLSRAIVAFGDKATPRALQMLADDRWYVKRNLLGILAEIGNASNLVDIAPHLRHNDERVAKEAVRTLWRLGGDQGLEALAAAWPELAPGARMHVVMLFGALKWNAGRGLLERTALTEGQEDLQGASCEALGKIAAPESFPVLARLYKKKGLVGREKRLPVRRAALKALQNYGDAARPYFQSALEERDPTLLQTARIGLERLTDSPDQA